MSSLRLNLGWGQVLEADHSALTAILGVCRALDIPVHCNEAESALYIAAPAHGRRLALACGPNSPEAAERILQGLRDRLSAAGAAVTVVDSPSAPLEQELVLRVDFAPPQAKGVSAAFNWIGWRLNRRLASLLTEELSRALNLPDLGGHASLSGWRQSGVPVVEVSLPALDHDIPRAIDALCRGLTRFWSNPLLEEVLMSISDQISIGEAAPEPERQPEPEPTPEPELEQLVESAPAPVPESISEPTPVAWELREEPRLILGPETIVAWRQEPLPRRALRPALHQKRDAKPAKVRETASPNPAPAPTSGEAAPVAPAAPATPAPAATFPALQTASNLHVFQWSKPLIARAAPPTSLPGRNHRPAIFQHGVPLVRPAPSATMQNHPR